MEAPDRQWQYNTNYVHASSLSPAPPSPTPERECAPRGIASTQQFQPSTINASMPQQTSSPPGAQAMSDQPVKPKVARPRAPKAPKDPNAPVKPRAPRKPKDPNAPPAKRRKKNGDVNADGTLATTSAPAGTSQSTSGLATASVPQPSQQYASTITSNPIFPHLTKVEPMPEQPNASHPFGTIQQPAQPHSRVPSQQRAAFDPIRSASLENARLANTPTPTPAATHQSPHRPLRSPNGIPSLDTMQRHDSVASMKQRMNQQTPPPPAQLTQMESSRATPTKLSSASTATSTAIKKVLQLEGTASEKPIMKATTTKAATKEVTPSRPSSPKPASKKKASPKPSGSLLSGADFGKKIAEPKIYAQVPNNCIVIDVPITGRTNNYVNFLKEVENKYGFDAAYPRIAEHKRRMAQMAAEGAALEKDGGAAEGMSEDLSSMEDSDVEMAGVNGEESGTATDAKKKKTKMGPKDKYDLDDDFVDDTELAWTEQALASKDGYFVWNGPLIQEDEIPNIERADGKVTRGRGRGRAGTARGGGGARGGKAETGTGEKKSSRGTGKPRGTRKTKSEREAAEKAKASADASTNGATPLTNGDDLPGLIGAA